MPRMVQLELYSGRVADGGAALAALPCLECRTLIQLESPVWTSQLQARIDSNWDQSGLLISSALYPQRLLHPTYLDGSFDEYTIDEIGDSSGGDGSMSLVGKDLIYDLARRDRLISEDLNGQVSYSVRRRDYADSLLDFILGFAPSSWVRGNVNITPTLELVMNSCTPLAAAKLLCEAMTSYSGTVYEIYRTWDSGAGKYKLHIEVRNANITEYPTFRFGKNLLGTGRTTSGKQMVNRVEVIDPANVGLGENHWLVSNLVANTSFEIGKIDTPGAGSPAMLEIDALNLLYVVDESNGKHQITDSEVLTNTVTLHVASTAGIANGNWVKIARDSSGNPIRYVEKPSSQAVFGILHATLPRGRKATTNWWKNPDLADWSGTVPTNWTNGGVNDPAKITTAGLWLTGGQSAGFDGSIGQKGLQQQRSVYCLAGQVVTYTVWYYLSTLGSASNYIRFVDPQTGTPTDKTITAGGDLTTLNQWLSVSVSFTITTTGSKTLNISAISASFGAVFYIDSAMAVFGTDTAFVVGSGGALNLLDGLALIRENANAAVAYAPKIADLTRLDGTRWPNDEMLPGVTTRIVDDFLNDTFLVRAMRLNRNERDPPDTQVVLSTRPPTLTGLLTAAGI